MKSISLLLLLLVGSTTIGFSQQNAPTTQTFDKNVKILFKPKPSWGDGQDCSVGTVILRIEFLESGRIGQISLVKGLTENRNTESIKAARKIKFKPAKKNGKNITLFRMVAFPFSFD